MVRMKVQAAKDEGSQDDSITGGKLNTMPRPVPLPRKQISLPDKTGDDEPFKSSSAPQSPTKSPKRSSTPPPVAPKTWVVKKSPGGSDYVNSGVEIVKVPAVQSDDKKCKSPPPPLPQKHPEEMPDHVYVTMAPDEHRIYESCKAHPPPLPWKPRKQLSSDESEVLVTAKQSDDECCKAHPPPPPLKPPKKQPDEENELDGDSLMDWWKDVTPWTSLCKDLKLRGKKETKVIRIKAEHLYNAIQVYILLLSEHGGFLKEQTAELLCIADNLDKVSKNTKIAGITGGATTVAGGVAAAAGVILSPFTLGVSLGLTVVGVGVAAAGGVTGASAAIANKVNVTQDKKKIEKTFQDYEHIMGDIQNCLKFINDGMEQLKQHDLSVLSEARTSSVRVGRAIELATTGGGSAKAIEANSKAAGLMQGFALGIDIHFTQGKDGKKMKKGHESKLAKKIRSLSEDLNLALDELMQIRDLFSKHCSRE